LIIGLAIGYLLTKSVRVAQAFVAGYMGFSVGMIVNSLVLYMLESETVFWVTICCFTLGMATLGCVCHSKHMCWITALAGAYITMRGIALVTGHAQDQFGIIDAMKAGAFTRQEAWVWFYFLMFVILLLLGMWF